MTFELTPVSVDLHNIGSAVANLEARGDLLTQDERRQCLNLAQALLSVALESDYIEDEEES